MTLEEYITFQLQRTESEPVTKHLAQDMVKCSIERYRAEREKSKKRDILIPFHECVLKDEIVKENTFNGKKVFSYKWPERGGFEGEPKICHQLAEGEYIDRIGEEWGYYASPVQTDKCYNFSDRALPYYHTEEEIRNEPSYHLYRVVRTITVESVLEKMREEMSEAEMRNEEREKIDYYKGRIATLEIAGYIIQDGDVAEVTEFGVQGKGGGRQYRFSIPIFELCELKFLIEIN